jgi:hypothetical protein
MSYSRTSDAGPALRDRDEERLPNDGDPRCGSCGEACAVLTLCEWDSNLQVGACCAVAEEDECACRFTGDRADSSECLVHGMSAPTAPRIGDTTEVEQWEGGRVVTHTLVWDGARYVARKAVGSETSREIGKGKVA